jgi:hypothetical protein
MRSVSRSILSIAVLVACATPLHAQASGGDETKFTNRETALWQSVKDKQVDQIKKVFGDDYVAVYDSGIIGRDDELKGISATNLRNVRLDNAQVHRIDPSNVVVTGKAVVEGDTNGKSINGTYNTMTVWHRTGNRWGVVAHTEVKAP